ncbi:putative polyamine transporter At3g13620 isoform X2 [Wolffia australiana]
MAAPALVDVELAAAGENEGEKESRKKTLSLIPLIFIIFFEVSGGAYGAEPTVQAAGPLLAMIGFVVFPFVWSVPEALITAELATAFAGDGGYVSWVTAAFGPFPGFLMGTWKYFTCVINNAAYPVLCADYLSRISHRFSGGSAVRDGTITGLAVVLSLVNYTGLAIVGWGSVALGLAAMAPFVVMAAAALPKIRPERWLRLPETRMTRADWSLYLNTLFWNLNYWDSVSTLAGEVKNPKKTLPRALLTAGLLICIGYLVPLLATTGALQLSQDQWTDGFFADAAGMIVGKWLKVCVEVGAVLSAIGLYEAALSACSFQLLGMADLGLLPRFLAVRSAWFGTPWLAIIVSTAITLAFTFMRFEDIVAAANFTYALSMLLEFAAFLWLRQKKPLLKRPFRVPASTPWLAAMCTVPSAFIVLVMFMASWRMYAVSAGMTSLGAVLYFLSKALKAKKWLAYADPPCTEH